MEEKGYDFTAIETKWQRRWAKTRAFRFDPEGAGEVFYDLMMYPYPSGVLHMGHVINYSIGDAIARYQSMRGKRVFAPMGWDSFGLPAENYAIRHGRHPEETTRQNIDAMRAQFRRAGWFYDFGCELATSHPGYYRWTQWLFLKFYEAGLAFRRKAPVNWCPSCSTVLANEQVHNGCCERCDTEVEQRDLVQWFYNMSAYAQRLLDGHRALRGRWPENVLKMQEDWIGRSEGARLTFKGVGGLPDLPVFTTRPDTVHGVTYMAVAPEHPIVELALASSPRRSEALAAINEIRKQSVIERTAEHTPKVGIPTGGFVENPFTGRKIPLWVTNYALMDYGTGAVMAVPAHDQRDFEFAKTHRLPIVVVIQPDGEALDPATMEAAHTGPGRLVNSGSFDGLPNHEAMAAITAHAAKEGFGEATVNYRLKNWLLSRQRYWGAPIPIIHCPSCGEVPVPEKDLPVLLPKGVEFKETGESPLARCPDFVNTSCPRCGGAAKREVDTMDTFVDSSWYFLRFPTPRAENACFDQAALRSMLPVHQYVGGIEHATMHLIYARFFTMVLHDLGLVPFTEPFKRLFCQGMVCRMAYYCSTHKWIAEETLVRELQTGKEALLCPHCRQPVRAEMAKMSKTKLNGVSPDEMFDRYGADCTHLAILFLGPPNRDLEFNEKVVLGMSRFLGRVWAAFEEYSPQVGRVAPYRRGQATELQPAERELRRKTHEMLRWVTHAFEVDEHPDTENNFHFNTCISQLMELLNTIRSSKAVRPEILREALEALALALNPFAPHLAEELGQRLGLEGGMLRQAWPVWDEDAVQVESIELVLQVNGKVRSRLQVPVGLGQPDVEVLAFADETLKKHLEGKTVRKVIHVKDKLVNIVAG